MTVGAHELPVLLCRHLLAVRRWGYRNTLEPYGKSIKNWARAQLSCIREYSLEELRARRSTDTIFILGSGPSLGCLTQDQVDRINGCASFGLNFSFLRQDIVPTYYIMSYEPGTWLSNLYKQVFSEVRDKYSNTVFYINNKALYLCLAHPAFSPRHFAANPKLYIEDLPQSISLDEERPFCFGDFQKTLFYRGTLSLVLHYAVELGYQEIVLLGVDPDSRAHFYTDYPSMAAVEAHNALAYRGCKKAGYEYMSPKGNKYHPMDVYFRDVARYLLEERGVRLCAQSSDVFLASTLPAYF